MVGFHLPNILRRKTRPRTAEDSSSPVEMAECDSPQQGRQQSDSQNPPGPSTQKSSGPSRELSSALPSRPGAIAPATPLSSPTSGATASRKRNTSNRNNSSNSKNNNIRRRPTSVKRKSSDSTSRARTPTRNTDIPIPTVIHPSTPLPPPSSSPRSRSSTCAQKPRLTRHPSQRKPILKLPTAAKADGNEQRRQTRAFSEHTYKADTRNNTERNTRRNSAPPPMSALNCLIPFYAIDHEEPHGYENESEDGKTGGKGKSKSRGTGAGAGAGAGAATGTGGRSGSLCSHRSKHNNEQNEKKRKREQKKMVRFGRVDVHPYEVERGGESSFRFFSRRAGEGIGNENENENGRVGNRDVDIFELGMDLDLREYVMDIPDVIQG